MSFVAAMLLALIATGISIPLLRRARVMDVPNARSSHRRATPRGGGTAVLLSATAVSIVGELGRIELAVLLAAIVSACLGLMDDLRGLSPAIRLVVQSVTGILLATALVVHEFNGALALSVGLTALGALWLVAYMNAFNFMDGINGISAGSAVVAGIWFACLGGQQSSPGLTLLGLAVAGAACGFLPWNAPRARVFLGDVGSYGLGMMIGGLALLALAAGSSPTQSVAPLVVYVADTGWTLVKRAARGASLHQAHRDHVYQRMVDGGWAHISTSALIVALTATSCCIAAVVPSIGAAIVLGLVAVVYLALPSVLLSKTAEVLT